jgi:hypothetical protein
MKTLGIKTKKITQKKKSVATKYRPYDVQNIPPEIWLYLFSFLRPNDVGRAAQVCKYWNSIAQTDSLWKGFSFLHLPSKDFVEKYFYAEQIATKLSILKEHGKLKSEDSWLQVYLSLNGVGVRNYSY